MPNTPVSEREAFWFGVEQPRCFGMLHRPPTKTNRGVVICDALGFEGLIAHRAFFHLAERLTARGDTVLRFDYEGTGDADGGDWEPGRIKEWLASIDEAVGILCTREGVTEIYLVGLRMGATLATLYAADHPDIAGLVLWSPCVDGGTHVRELLALSRLAAASRPAQHVTSDWFPENSLEVAGFEMARSTIDDLKEISLVDRLLRAPAPAALVVDHPDGGTSASDLVSRLSELGTTVDYDRIAGYGAFMVDDETKSVLPDEVLDRIAIWLAQARPGPAVVNAAFPTVSPTLVVAEPTAGHLLPFGLTCGRVVEEVAQIGGRLFAIVSEPLERASRRRVAVVILNTGSTNRSGQGRLSVAAARYWASLGFTTVRVDLGGTGDSRATDPALENNPYAQERIDEVIEAVAWAGRELDVDHVLLYGICSGAYQSFHAALKGVAVERAILVNPAVFYYHAHRGAGMDVMIASNARRALTSRSHWRKALRNPKQAIDSLRRAQRGFAYLAKAWGRAHLRRLGFRVQDPLELAFDLNRIAGRGIDLLIVFAAAEAGEHYLRTFGGKALVALEAKRRVSIEGIDGGDHVFSAPAARQQLIERVTAYLEATYPAPSSRPA